MFKKKPHGLMGFCTQLLEEKAKANPPTPQETREMAKYFGINPR
jgi:hypothetical protein